MQRMQRLIQRRYAEVTDLTDALKQVLASPTVASKEWVYNQYDYMVRTSTAVQPGSDAAVVTIRGRAKRLAMTTDCNGRYVTSIQKLADILLLRKQRVTSFAPVLSRSQLQIT